jgi:iron complex transport system permease protein
MSIRVGKKSPARSLLLLAGLGVLAVIVSVFIGRYPAPYWMSPSVLWKDDLGRRLVFYLRVPRILTAYLMGMTLSAAGTVMQTIFRNPLVSPGFLGVSQGAAFGAALGIIFFGASAVVIEVSATLFALLALVFAYLLAWNIRYGDWVLRLVLAGIISSALFSSGIGVLKYVADPLEQLPSIVFWLMGGLWNVTWRDFFYVLPVAVASLVALYLLRWRLNILALRDDTAFSLGVSPFKERAAALVAAVAGTAVVVAVAGIVGWIGLIVPHMTRRIVGTDVAYVLPGSMLLGGTLALICDNLARTVLAGEIPLGIVSSLLGSILFVMVFFRNDVRMTR